MPLVWRPDKPSRRAKQQQFGDRAGSGYGSGADVQRFRGSVAGEPDPCVTAEGRATETLAPRPPPPSIRSGAEHLVTTARDTRVFATTSVTEHVIALGSALVELAAHQAPRRPKPGTRAPAGAARARNAWIGARSPPPRSPSSRSFAPARAGDGDRDRRLQLIARYGSRFAQRARRRRRFVAALLPLAGAWSRSWCSTSSMVPARTARGRCTRGSAVAGSRRATHRRLGAARSVRAPLLRRALVRVRVRRHRLDARIVFARSCLPLPSPFADRRLRALALDAHRRRLAIAVCRSRGRCRCRRVAVAPRAALSAFASASFAARFAFSLSFSACAAAAAPFAASFSRSSSRSSRRFSRIRRRPPVMISAISWSYSMPHAFAISTRSE